MSRAQHHLPPLPRRRPRLQRFRRQRVEHPLPHTAQHLARRGAMPLHQIARRQRAVHLPSYLLLQLIPVPAHPGVKVRLRATREIAQQPAAANHLHQRLIHVVIPISNRFLQRHRLPPFLLHPALVIVNLLPQDAVLPRLRHRQIRFRAHLVQIGLLHKIDIFGPRNHLIWLHVRRQRHLDFHFRHISRNVRRPQHPRHRNAVVAIKHKIRVAQLIEQNWRHLLHAIKRRPHPRPPLLVPLAPRQKGTCKIRIAPHATHNGIQRRHLQAAAQRLARLQLLRHITVTQQLR